MIERIVPAPAVAVEAFGDPVDVELFPEEAAVVASAVTKRQREFATVRHCARTALAELGYPPVPILPGSGRAPQWPAGVVGSMTHCDGYRAAVLGLAEDFAAIGLDAEPHQPLPPDVVGTIIEAGEQARLPELYAGAPSVHWDRLVFCAKEAVYKTWFPLTGRWLDFAEADVTVHPGAGTFAARLLVPGPVVDGEHAAVLDGRFLVSDGLIVTLVSLPLGRRPRRRRRR